MAGPTPRVAYNAKGRQSTAGSRKKGKPKKKDRSEATPSQPESDPNASVLVPKSKEDKEAERKAKLLQELASQSDSKWTSKKKKRLEKYIDKKLKKEERVLIFDKLSKTQATSSSVVLQSSATLGTGKPLTHQQLQDKEEDALVKKTLLGQTGKRKRRQDAYHVLDNEPEDDEDEEMLGIEGRASPPDISNSSPAKDRADIVVVDASTNEVTERHEPSKPAVGSALQRNADGSVVAPKVRARSKGKALQRGWGRRTAQQMEPESDTSFDSSDSENDTNEEDDGSSEEEEEEDDDDDGLEPQSEDDDEEQLSEPEQPQPEKKKRTLGFKDWAMKQLNAAKGYEPPTSPEQVNDPSPGPDEPKPKKRKLAHDPTSLLRGPLGEDLKLPLTSFAKQILNPDTKPAMNSYVKVVQVKRSPEVEEARILLPIVTEEQPIMEAILLNPIIIICGETGSGKTTQVPQFLYEAGFGTPGSENPGMVGITQPRRVAAMSMASRVGHELSLTSSVVSYQIRYDATVSPNTSIKFMTDGVLLRELATDFLLTKYSVIIVDEAHERSINTDILIGVLSRVIKLREEMWKTGKENIKPLRLIIMSATLRVSDFAENKTLFPSPPPVINVAARQHPVTIHFSRRTYPDYVTQAVKKASKIHTRLPPGGILIFLTGQAEIVGVCRKLEAKFSKKAIEEKKKRLASRTLPTMRIDDGPSDFTAKTVNPAQADVEAEEMDLGNTQEDDLAADVDEDMNEADPEDLESDDDEVDVELGIEDDTDVPMHVVPLYSLLPSEKQMQVFQPPPPGTRLVVVSTNVAETSLTIPGIRYVIDCGRAKERHYDIANGIQTFRVSWIAKASAAQRAGRAGRTGPGHCYRLYSSALFEHHFDNFAVPEIQRMPIEGVVLQMKSMHIDAVINFPFPTPPDRTSLLKAEKTLAYLGALKSPQPSLKMFDDSKTQITDLGRAMALFPLSPRFSRMLVGAQQHGCLPYVICIISALSVGDPFVYEDAIAQEETADIPEDDAVLAGLTSEAARQKEITHQRRKTFFQSQHLHSSLGNYTSDLFKMLSVVGAYEYSGGGQKFCSEHFVRPKAMEEIHKLRAQISSIVHTNFPATDPNFVPNLAPPNDFQLKVLRQLLTAGFIDQVAVRKDLVDKNESSGTQYSTSKNVAYRALGIQEDVYIHPSSLLAGSSPPDFLVYHEVVRTAKVYLKGLTKINPTWLSSLGKNTLCTFSKPIKNNVGTLMTIPKFGPDGWELPAIKAEAV
ncbi:hypothetical protein D9613_006038 [Agrocybe pediades]|uniref:RNA helicase n=1 Tax=Agrocybe pediades TaxID=84607 RepID=A0A8H4QUQ5_9AGAR|nr:hypothetical protein D9613_006038 [Agrocybe pediades]